MAFAKKKRITDPKLLESVRQKDCLICGHGPRSHPHHLKSVKSGGPDHAFNVIALCFRCHRRIHNLGLYAMVNKNVELWSWLLTRGWVLDSASGKWRNDAF